MQQQRNHSLFFQLNAHFQGVKYISDKQIAKPDILPQTKSAIIIFKQVLSDLVLIGYFSAKWQQQKNIYNIIFCMFKNNWMQKIAIQFEFKNALHYGHFCQSSKLSHIFSKTTLHESSNKTPLLKNTLNGFGLSIIDNGVIVLADWYQSSIYGKYFIYVPGSSSLSGNLCYYGCMQQKQMYGWNHIVGANGVTVSGEFLSGKLNGNCIIHKDKINLHGKQSQEKVNHHFNKQKQKQTNLQNKKNISKEVIKMEYGYKFKQHKVQSEQQLEHNCTINQKKNFKVNNLGLSRLNLQIKQQKYLRLVEHCSEAYMNLVNFIQLMIQQHHSRQINPEKQKQQHSKEPSLQLFKFSDTQIFVGSIYNLHCTDGLDKCQMTGCGFILNAGWPVCYGQFKQGKLDGLGRRYETQFCISDGIFQNDKICQGFILDLYNNRIYIGHKQKLYSDKSQDIRTIITSKLIPSQSQFIEPIKKQQINSTVLLKKQHKIQFKIHKVINQINYQLINNFRKIYHLKSLKYTQQYLNIYNIPVQIWPEFLIRRVKSQQIVSHMLNNFLPLMMNNQLSRIDNYMISSTDNKIQKDIISILNEKKNLKNTSVQRNNETLQPIIWRPQQSNLKLQGSKGIINQMNLSKQRQTKPSVTCTTERNRTINNLDSFMGSGSSKVNQNIKTQRPKIINGRLIYQGLNLDKIYKKYLYQKK